MIGERILDYELLGQLGRGAMGTVYEARHTRLKKNVAIKLLPAEFVTDPAVVSRFHREMQAVGRLEHPNIIHALDAGEVDGVSFLVMERIDGIDLAELTSDGRTLNIADACEIVRQAAVGLHYAHEHGLVHRDVKPSNLMVSAEKSEVSGQNPVESQINNQQSAIVKLLDLGLAMIQDSRRELTDNETLMGTLDYIAPEQSVEAHSVDRRADIYSLGATFYRILAGRTPFEDPKFNSPNKRLKALTTAAAPGIAAARDDLPLRLSNLIDRMLAREPDDRPGDLQEVIAALEEFSQSHRLTDLLASHKAKQLTRTPNDDAARLVDTTASWAVPTNRVLRAPRAAASRATRLGMLLIGAVAVVAAVLMWLRTDGGYIRFERSDASINMSVKVLKDGQYVETVQVGRGDDRYWYRSGQYEIRMAAGEDDQLDLDGDVFTLTRHGEQVVRISRVAMKVQDPLPLVEPAKSRVNLVTTLKDGLYVPGSLRAVIAGATEGDTIRFDPTFAGKTITLYGQALSISQGITIDASDLTAMVTIDADGKSRVLELLDEHKSEVRIVNLSITGGKPSGEGGGIVNTGNTVLISCRIVNNSSNIYGGGVVNKEGGMLRLEQCWVTQNTAETWGGGIFNAGKMDAYDCVVTDNSAKRRGAGVANWGGHSVLKNCLIAKNTAAETHAGLQNVNSGSVELIHCTVVDNHSAGIGATPPSTVILDSTIVANNEGDRGDFYISGNANGLTTRGVNIIKFLKKGNVDSGPQPLSVDPLLAPLGEYGGPFPTMPPLKGSPAIDAAIGTESTPATDIRGVTRPLDGNGDGTALPDIGAVEFDPRRDSVTSADSGMGEKKAAVALPTRDLPDITKLPKGKVRVFGTASQAMEMEAAAEFDDFVEVQMDSNIGWFGLRSNGDVMRWHVDQGVTLYREGQDVRVLNRTAGTSYGEWLASDGKIVTRSHPDRVLMANAPQADIVDLARAYPTGDWTVLTNDGRLRYIGETEFLTPTEITDFVRIGNWHDHHVGIRENGRLVVWGRDPTQLPDLNGHQFTKIRSTEFYTLLLTEQGTLVHLTKEQIVELPEEFERDGWIDIACGNLIYAARQTDGRWRAWGDPSAAEVIAKINSLGANVPSISMTKDAAVWIETE